MSRRQCHLCPESFESVAQLAAHQAEHRGKLPYKCPGCPAAFLRRKELHVHIRGQHRDERIYECHLCPYTFKKRANLTAHLKVHFGGLLYRCHLCGERFRARYILSNHLRGKLPYKCPGCPAAFLQCKELHVHIRGQHRDERIYECHLCPYTFKKRANLTAHLKVHFGGLLYRCHLCGERFRARYMLSNHLRRKHVPNPRRKRTPRTTE